MGSEGEGGVREGWVVAEFHEQAPHDVLAVIVAGGGVQDGSPRVGGAAAVALVLDDVHAAGALQFLAEGFGLEVLAVEAEAHGIHGHLAPIVPLHAPSGKGFGLHLECHAGCHLQVLVALGLVVETDVVEHLLDAGEADAVGLHGGAGEVGEQSPGSLGGGECDGFAGGVVLYDVVLGIVHGVGWSGGDCDCCAWQQTVALVGLDLLYAQDADVVSVENGAVGVAVGFGLRLGPGQECDSYAVQEA